MSRIHDAAAAAMEDLMCASSVQPGSDIGAAFSDAVTALNRSLELLRRDHGAPPQALASFVRAWAVAMDAESAAALTPSANITRESLEQRARELSAQIKELPTPELFRLVADFIDTEQWAFARQTAPYAVTRLNREAPAPGTEKPRLESPQ